MLIKHKIGFQGLKPYLSHVNQYKEKQKINKLYHQFVWHGTIEKKKSIKTSDVLK